MWNFDLTTAPRGKTVTSARKVGNNTHEITDFVPDVIWLATKCGKVSRSYWIPESGKTPARWSGLATREEPVAWQAYIVPEHPHHQSDVGAVAEIPLNKGLFAKVDASDYQDLIGSTWFAVERGNAVYAARSVLGKMEYMHRVILGLSGSERADHANRDGLDNRRSNLRISTPSENRANAALSSNNTSGFKGVIASGDKWVARIKVAGERLYLGTYETAEKAADAYDKAAVEAFGEFACLNSTLTGKAQLASADSAEPSASGQNDPHEDRREGHSSVGDDRANAGGGHVTEGENPQPVKAGEHLVSSPDLIVHKHVFLDDAGSGA